jgi:hypothetical protein
MFFKDPRRRGFSDDFILAEVGQAIGNAGETMIRGTVLWKSGPQFEARSFDPAERGPAAQ